MPSNTLKKNGITTETLYPYVAVTQTCQTKAGAYKVTGFKNVLRSFCSQLKTALVAQPVSVGVDAEEWQFYSGGVFNNCGKTLDHGVLAVGYDTSNNWLVKNSWGTTWGVNGFITL